MAEGGSNASTDFLPLMVNESTNQSGFLPSIPDWHRDFVGAFYFLLAFPSCVLHILVFLSVLKTHGHFGQFPPFYVLITNHYLADVIKTLFYIFYACPCIWTGSQVYGDRLGVVLGEFESVDYCAILFSIFFMSVNRALAIGAPGLSEKLFTNQLAVIYNVLTWAGGAAVSGINKALSCKTVFLENKFVFSTVCIRKLTTSPGAVVVYVFVYGVTIFYLFALWSLAKFRRQVSDSEITARAKTYQIRLFLQAMAIWMGVVGNAIAFRIIPLFQPGLGTVIATGAVIIGQSYITPICMLIFVSDTRGGILKVFGYGATTGPQSPQAPFEASHREVGQHVQHVKIRYCNEVLEYVYKI